MQHQPTSRDVDAVDPEEAERPGNIRGEVPRRLGRMTEAEREDLIALGRAANEGMTGGPGTPED